MNTLLIIIGIILIPFVLALFVPKELNYQKSIIINAPRDKVWPKVSSLEAMDEWNPWQQKDPNMQRTVTGEDGKVGSSHHWKSDVKGVGEGKQTITALDPPNRMDSRLEFIKPFKSLASGFVTVDDAGEGTKVTWGFESRMPYPMNIMKLFMNFERSMDKDFGQGLSTLKNQCEDTV